MKLNNYKMIAHRGLFNNEKGIPENSIEAFKLAVENDFAIELDVHITLDEEIVVFHDNNIKRMTGVNAIVEDCTFEYLSSLNLINTKYNIPKLKDVLDLIDGKVPLLIEIKNTRRVGKLELKLMEMLTLYNGKYIIESFNPLSLYFIRKRYPRVIIGQLASKNMEEVSSNIKRFILENMLLNFLVKPNFIAYDINYINERFVNKCHRQGRYLYGWTAKTKKEIENFIKICDGVIFEKPKE